MSDVPPDDHDGFGCLERHRTICCRRGTDEVLICAIAFFKRYTMRWQWWCALPVNGYAVAGEKGRGPSMCCVRESLIVVSVCLVYTCRSCGAKAQETANVAAGFYRTGACLTIQLTEKAHALIHAVGFALSFSRDIKFFIPCNSMGFEGHGCTSCF